MARQYAVTLLLAVLFGTTAAQTCDDGLDLCDEVMDDAGTCYSEGLDLCDDTDNMDTCAAENLDLCDDDTVQDTCAAEDLDLCDDEVVTIGDMCDADTDICADDPESPTPPVKKVVDVSFDIKVKVAKSTDFDNQKYLEKVAQQSGVDVAKVNIIKKEFVIEVGYSFSADTPITKDQAKEAIAKDWNVPASMVTVTISNTGRRLAVTTKVVAALTTTDPAQADSVKAAAADASGVKEQMKTLYGVTSDVVVEKQPELQVKVTTNVRVQSGQSVAKPGSTTLADIAAAAGGTGATLDQGSWKETEREVLQITDPSTSANKTTFTGSVEFSIKNGHTVPLSKAEAASLRTLAKTCMVSESAVSTDCQRTARRLQDFTLRRLESHAATSQYTIAWAIKALPSEATYVGYRLGNLTNNHTDFTTEFRMQLLAAGVPLEAVNNMTVTLFEGGIEGWKSGGVLEMEDTSSNSFRTFPMFSALVVMMVSMLLPPTA